MYVEVNFNQAFWEKVVNKFFSFYVNRIIPPTLLQLANSCASPNIEESEVLQNLLSTVCKNDDLRIIKNTDPKLEINFYDLMAFS